MHQIKYTQLTATPPILLIVYEKSSFSSSDKGESTMPNNTEFISIIKYIIIAHYTLTQQTTGQFYNIFVARRPYQCRQIKKKNT